MFWLMWLISLLVRLFSPPKPLTFWLWNELGVGNKLIGRINSTKKNNRNLNPSNRQSLLPKRFRQRTSSASIEHPNRAQRFRELNRSINWTIKTYSRMWSVSLCLYLQFPPLACSKLLKETKSDKESSLTQNFGLQQNHSEHLSVLIS